MRVLVIDIGNTKAKAGIFNAGNLLEEFLFETKNTNEIESILSKHKITHSIISSVAQPVEELEKILQQKTIFTKLSSQTILPFTNKYATPATLGMDRVAAIAGAMHYFSNTNCLVIDMGTCITFDFITANNEYLGGAISPGLQMRLKAMHHFTQKLPDVSFKTVDDFVGNSTESCMQSGTFYGILSEINETINRYEQRYGSIQVITCGGDSTLFDKHIKSNIFAAPFLVLYGLNKILTFNA
jgi:type III pantothenate kinase